ncbi:uncharacterized protein LOC117603182 [Osmia lignaria lignaria]|uniref:uncharacterized protein LOC117603182 n=1 Tax=Osmia lignaria lignaria TaxID=1437193 RepID=UPI00402B9B28
MVYVCELLTEEPKGGSAMIPLLTFLDLYVFLAELDCSGECTCAAEDRKDTEQLFRPCGPSTDSDQTSTLDSKLFQVSSTTVEEAEDTGQQDICGFTASQDSRSTETLQVLKEFGVDARTSEIDVLYQEKEKEQQQLPREEEKIEADMIDHTEHEEKKESAQPEISPTEEKRESMQHADHTGRASAITESIADQQDTPDFPFFDMDDVYDRDEEPSSFGEEGSVEESMSLQRLDDDYKSIGLRNILEGICECLEPVPETVRTPTPPPPPDPFEEFLKRMKTEIEEDRLQMFFRVPGIGRPVSANRVTAVGIWLADCGRRQEGMVGPRNITHFLCPELEDTRDNSVSTNMTI